MTFSAAKLRVKRREYERHYRGSGVSHKAISVTVPDDIGRVEVSAPCTFCGVARGPCGHRPFLAGPAEAVG